MQNDPLTVTHLVLGLAIQVDEQDVSVECQFILTPGQLYEHGQRGVQVPGTPHGRLDRERAVRDELFHDLLLLRVGGYGTLRLLTASLDTSFVPSTVAPLAPGSMSSGAVALTGACRPSSNPRACNRREEVFPRQEPPFLSAVWVVGTVPGPRLSCVGRLSVYGELCRLTVPLQVTTTTSGHGRT